MDVLLQVFMILVISSSIIQCQGTPAKTPPQITTPFLSEYYVTEKNSEAKTFQCSATGYPTPKYEWRKDGVKLQNSLQIKVDETTGKMSIIAAEIADYGSYQCFAVNELGTAVSAEFQVNRGFITQFTNQVLRTLPNVNEFKSVSISCLGQPTCRPSQDCNIEWKRGTGTTDTILETKRIAVDTEGTLHFLYVLVDDHSTAAVPIACGMNHEPAKAFYKGGDVILTVMSVTNPTQYKPVALFSQDVKGLLNGQVTLQCVFSGYPLPDIEWLAPDNKVIEPGLKYLFKDNTIRRDLIIKQLTDDDEGIYKCKGVNYAGIGVSEVFLNVTSKPVFPKGEPRLESAVVPIGEDAIFACKMRSLKNERPPTAPVWRRNGELLPQNQIGSSPSQKYQLSDDKTVLTIKNVQKPGDSCSIMCEAGNVIIDDNGDDKFVMSYADASLRIIEPIKVTVISQQVLELDEPKPFSMSITATTDETIPKLIYEWSLTRPDNKTVYPDAMLSTKPWVTFNPDKNNLTIVPELGTADDDDDKVRDVVGIYRVNISHQYDYVVVAFEINTNLEQVTKSPIVQSAGFDLWIIGLILGIIVLIIVVVFIICTLYRNRGGEYPVDKKEVAAGHDPEKELKDSGFHDLSRADGEKTPFDRVSLSDDVKPLESDEDSMMGDYDDDADMTKFNEDGSFIGLYMDKKGLLNG